MASSIGFRMLSFLPSRYSSYGAWTLTPVGLAPTDHASLRWTHRLPLLIRPDLPQRHFWPGTVPRLVRHLGAIWNDCLSPCSIGPDVPGRSGAGREGRN